MIYVASHRRAGTHLTMETLTLNFNCDVSEEKGCKTHKNYYLLKKKLKPEDKIVYVVRDPRDTMLSCFEWWKCSNEALKSNILREVVDRPFLDFISGNIKVPLFKPNMVEQWEHDEGIITDPIHFWKQHVISYLGAITIEQDKRVNIIRYEDIKKPEFIKKLGEKLELVPRFKDKFGIINDSVGYFIGPRRIIKNNSNKWKTEFTKEHHKVFKGKEIDRILNYFGYEPVEENAVQM